MFPDLVKIGFDSGCSSLKATLSLIDTTPAIRDSKEKSAFFKDSSVHKSFIVAFGSNLPESYDAMKFLFELLKINQRKDFKLNGDLKCMNLILGLQSHSSKFPCPFCSTFQHGLDQRTVTKYTPRTFEGIKQQYEAWTESGKPEADPQTFKNCRHPPLIERQGKTIDVVVPSPLHCLIGLVNKIYKSLLDVFPQAVAWPAKLHLVPQVQHGGNDFNGNACHQMLKNIAVLESLTITRQQKKVLDPFVACLHAFEKVVHGTFSHTHAPDFEDHIRMFADSFVATGISVTSKAHIVFHHLVEYLDETKRGLALDSEQSLESSHFLFSVTLSKYLIKDEANPKFIPKLISAICDYNGSHI